MRPSMQTSLLFLRINSWAQIVHCSATTLKENVSGLLPTSLMCRCKHNGNNTSRATAAIHDLPVSQNGGSQPCSADSLSAKIFATSWISARPPHIVPHSSTTKLIWVKTCPNREHQQTGSTNGSLALTGTESLAMRGLQCPAIKPT